MNRQQWKNLDKKSSDWFWRNKAVSYFNLQQGQIIHHLRDTKEQRDFNDKYYERWGFDFDGIMKYCVVMDAQAHREYHSNLRKGSSLTEKDKQKISKATKEAMNTEEVKKNVSIGQSKRFSSSEERAKQSKRLKSFFTNEENKKIWLEKIREAKKDKKWFTNGKKDIFSKDCPEGYYEGRSKIKNIPSKKRKKIKCIETGIIYDSVSETGICKAGEVANGKRETAGGLHWEWV